MNNLENPNTIDPEVNLADLFLTLWNAKWFIGLITFVFCFFSIVYALLQPNQYESFVILSPTSDDESSVLGGMSSQLGGLASLAGVQIGAGKSSESDQALAIMESWAFVEEFIVKQGIDKEIFAVKKWNSNNNSFVYDKKFIDENNKWILDERPTSWKIYEEFGKKLSISENKKNGMVTVSFEHHSPLFAQMVVTEFVGAINSHMRERKIVSSSKNIDYLMDQIDKTSNSRMRDIFYVIVQEQQKNNMLAQATPEYAFKTISKAMIASEKSKPVRSQIVILFTLLGFLIATFITYVYQYNGYEFNKYLPKKST